MNSTTWEGEAASSVEFLRADDELSTGLGLFYSPGLLRLQAGAARCDCLACREQQRQRTQFTWEST
jgi:hypothetical protein